MDGIEEMLKTMNPQLIHDLENIIRLPSNVSTVQIPVSVHYDHGKPGTWHPRRFIQNRPECGHHVAPPD
jgi:hypothetical protein